jgi:hypothetical protein
MCSLVEVYRFFTGACCFIALMMEAASTSEKTVADYMAQHPKRVIFIF